VPASFASLATLASFRLRLLGWRNLSLARPYNPHMMDELEFRKRSDEAIRRVKNLVCG